MEKEDMVFKGKVFGRAHYSNTPLLQYSKIPRGFLNDSHHLDRWKV